MKIFFMFKEKKGYKLLLITILIVLYTLLIAFQYNEYTYLEIKNDILINKFYQTNNNYNNDENNEYIAILKIPKIGLERGFYHPNSINNNVDFNIEILNDFTNYDDITEKRLILASHNGDSKYSYFKDLYQIELFDKVYIYYNYNIYTYDVIDIFEVEKSGIIEIDKNVSDDILMLITCIGSDRQLVIMAKKINNLVKY